jgi:hypothetical protein
MKYRTMPADQTFCPDCDHTATLLCEEDGNGPAFYICFSCRFVGHVGHKRLEVAEPDVVASYPEHVDRGWLIAFVAEVSAKLVNLRAPMTNDMAAVALARASLIARKLALKER